MHSPHHKGITDAIPEIIKGICHVTLSNSDDKGLHQISFHLLAVQQVNVGNKGEVLTVLNEDRNKLKIQKLFLRMELLSIFLPPFPLLFLPLLLPSSPPPPPLFSPQQDAAWTSARCHGNQDWGGFSCDWISLSTDWPDALM